MLPQKIFKFRIINLAENELQTTKFPDCWNSVTNSLTFLANSLTFPGFPGQWQPCKAATFQQFFNWFCFVPLWFSLSCGFASWGRGQFGVGFLWPKEDWSNVAGVPSGSSGIQMSALELGKSWGIIALVLIMKYLLKNHPKYFL